MKEEVESSSGSSCKKLEADAVVVVVVVRPATEEASAEESERGGCCRICHLSRWDDSDSDDDGLIELGCSCKNDLASAHRHCAQTWFNIKGDKICEICGSIACNISEIEAVGGGTSSVNSTILLFTGAERPVEAHNCWEGQRLLNFVLACVIFLFLFSWLFHFNVPA